MSIRRRDFLKYTAGTFLLNQLPMQGFGYINHAQEENENILVIIQLNGGNDGLNTLIPLDQYATYAKVRGKIAIPEDKILKIKGFEQLGMHPAMEGIYNLQAENKVNIIQDVGYPNPDFSHFRSTDIWNTASDSDKYVLSGWAGRYLNLLHPEYPIGYPSSKYSDPLSIQLGSVLNTSLQGAVFPMGMAISNPNTFFSINSESGTSIPGILAAEELSYLRQVAVKSNQYSEVVQKAATKGSNQTSYEGDWLSYQLSVVAKLISGGLKTKFYMVSIGGFDTHDNQAELADPTTGEHASLLSRVSKAVSSFFKDLELQGLDQKVMAMTYSEFGRRVKANASNGTDHGAAAPMFLFGPQVNPTVIGKNSILPENPKNDTSLPMQYDFRSVYASVLERWFCADSQVIQETLFDDFQSLPVVNGSACGFVTSLAPENEKPGMLQVYPNPATDFAQLSFLSDGGKVSIDVYNMRGERISRPVLGLFPKGTHVQRISAENMNSGIYMLRYQNGGNTEIKRLVVR